MPKQITPLVQAQFFITELAKYPHYSQHKHATHIKMQGVQGEPFGSATPSASLEMLVVNPPARDALARLDPGQKFNVYFELVEEDADASR